MTDIVDRLNNCGPCYYESSLRRDVEVERCVADAAVEITNLRDRVAELERENQTQRDMMQGKDDAIAELSFTVKELEAQVAALTADAKERQP